MSGPASPGTPATAPSAVASAVPSAVPSAAAVRKGATGLPLFNLTIIDDNPEDREMIRHHLLKDAEHKFVFQEAATGAKGIALCRSEGSVPDCVILDLYLPDMDGLDVIAALRNSGEGTSSDEMPFPLIVLTGLESGAREGRIAIELGAQDFLGKSWITPQSLSRAVANAVDRFQLTRKLRDREELIKKSAERLSLATKSAKVGVWEWDLLTQAVTWDPLMFELYGVEPTGDSRIPYSTWAHAVLPEDLAAQENILQDTVAGRGRSEREFRIRRGDGAIRVIQATEVAVVDEHQKPSSVVGVNRDITESKNAQEELRKLKAVAEAANRSKSEFLANMSHEIRTPMTAILGFATMLLNKSPEECAEIGCVQIIRRNALHLLELINEILDLSKIEASQMTTETVACDIPEMLSDIIALMRPRALETGLVFGVTFQGPIPRLIQTDPMRLRQILVNLIGNAIKFTENGGIKLVIADEGAGREKIVLRVDVMDSGIGMTPEQVGRLFQPFAQGDESITRKFGGTGLGLTISRRLARLLNGDVSVTSGMGRGSTFTLRIDGGSPAGVEMLQDLTEATLPVRAPDALHHAIRLSGRVLLVEDGRDNQRLLWTLLTDAGATVAIAENGQVGVQLATTHPFDLILMDMQMPVMDGYAATSELRRLRITTPIIALTAFAMAEDRSKCMSIGCTAYCTKPVNEDTLLKTVNQYLPNASSVVTTDGTKDAASTLSGRPEGALLDAGKGCPSEATATPGGASAASGLITSSFAGNPRMMKIIPEFVDGLPGEVRKMIDLLERKDLPALKRVVHQLLGACGGYGFDPVTQPASAAEESIKTSKALELITEEVESLIDVIRRIEGYDESKMPA